MANLYERLFGIQVMDCHLPGAMMKQEIDVLEIMRNINVFVAFHNYDLNSQVFVQRAEDSHHIDIIPIPHIFSSYRYHGIEIMNTSIDLIHKFWRGKLNFMNQFLFDSFVRGRIHSVSV
jgi:WASH complex subunit 7